MKHLTYIFALFAALSIVGCGCGDSEPPQDTSPNPTTSSFDLATEFPGVALPVQPGEEPNLVRKIDLFFLLDDSFWFNNRRMGVIPFNQADTRLRTAVAQGIMANVRDNVLPALQAQYPGETFDLAIGVGRYEDYTAYTNADGGQVDPFSLPFILNMPVLRVDYNQGGTDFDTLFDAALAREALGEGAPTQNFTRQTGPTSAYEALYQIGTGRGFDGNGNGATIDNGLPCSATAQGTAAPAAISGDVPAVQYADGGQDNDGHPVFIVQGEDGNQADPSCIASGDLGGAGWRRDAARFLIMATDISPSALFTDTPPRDDPAASPPTVLAPFPGTEANPPAFIRSQAGGTDAPRAAEQVPSGGFQSITRVNDAPIGAAGVQDAINALNSLDIEVFALGATTVIADDRKPNTQLPTDNPRDNNQIDAVISPDTPAITPFTFLSAVSIMTGTRLPETAGGSEDFPAVYNLGTVWPADTSTGTPLAINQDVVNDLVFRIGKWVDGGFLRTVPLDPTQTGIQFPLPALPTLSLDFTLELASAADLPGFELEEALVPVDNRIVEGSVQVPVYYTLNGDRVDLNGNVIGDGSAPAPTVVIFDDQWIYSVPASRTDELPLTDSVPFQIFVDGAVIGNQIAGTNDAEVAALQAILTASSTAVNVPSPPASANVVNRTGVFVHAPGSVAITVFSSVDAAARPRTAQLQSISNWCAKLRDLSWPPNVVEDPTVGTCAGPLPSLPPGP